MNQTTNYNFNVPVGSDIVNPLVQDFPNWESLDTILRNVANTGITTATHTKSGTIHTLTFSETTVPMIRFQATADFHTNDTFTVNGVSVSALTVSGAALPDGAFVIGSMVLCELRDNLLTVYSSGTDAETLEGHSASYFATDSDLQTVDGKADANSVLIGQLETNLTTPTYFNIVTGGDTETIVNQRCYKVGSLVHIEFTALRSVATSMGSVWGIIPAGYLPSSDVLTGLINRSDGESRAVACKVTSNTGYISEEVFNSMPANIASSFYIEYYI